MAIDRKLQRWVAAGLIDADTAAHIRTYEAQAGRPVLLWAVAGLGLLALGLGIILVVSANWDRIADWVKLAVHLAITGAALAGVWFAARRPGRLWQAEGALFLSGVLLLAGLALHAQVYQLSGPAWHMLLLWLLLMSPAVLLAGATWLTGIGWALMLVGGLTAMAVDVKAQGLWLLAQGLAMAVPATLIALSFLPGLGTAAFRQALRAVGMVSQLAGASMAHLAWATELNATEAWQWAVRLLPAAVATVAALATARRWPDALGWPLLLALLLGPLVAVALALAVPHPDAWGSRLVGALVYAMMWGWVARAASDAGWGSLFGVAIAAIAVRIFLVYVELFGSLAATGIGLMLGGVLLVLLAFGWRRLMQGRVR